MKVFVIYDSKYGNTKIAAENILEGIKQVEGTEVAIGHVKEVDLQRLFSYDTLILGSPNHMASPSRTMKKFVEKLVELDLKARNVAVFGTYSGKQRNPDRAVKKMEKIMEKSLPNIKLLLPSLSIKVKGVTGPLTEGELPKCIDFGKRIANQLNSLNINYK
jgi:flavorubredoxin